MAQNYYRTLFIDTINDYSMMAQFIMSQFLLAKFMNIAAKPMVSYQLYQYI